MSDLIVYMPLLNEGTDVWRPVQATRLADDRFVIQGPAPDDEMWTFPAGSTVRCEEKAFSGGDSGLAVIGLA